VLIVALAFGLLLRDLLMSLAAVVVGFAQSVGVGEGSFRSLGFTLFDGRIELSQVLGVLLALGLLALLAPTLLGHARDADPER
jgi:hypothetical protein